MHERFNKMAKRTAAATGKPVAFMAALSVILVWAMTGPIFGFNNTWQLVINTGTTIVTFLMVFLIQNSQNRDTTAMQVKLDELIHVLAKADNRLLDLEDLDERGLEEKRRHFGQIAREARMAEPESNEKVRPPASA